MALQINLITDQTNMAMFTSPGRVYVDSTRTRVVSENSEEAAYLLVPAGGQLPMVEAIKFGLVEVEVKTPEAKLELVEPDPDAETDTDTDETTDVDVEEKAVESGRDKAVSRFRNK